MWLFGSFLGLQKSRLKVDVNPSVVVIKPIKVLVDVKPVINVNINTQGIEAVVTYLRSIEDKLLTVLHSD